MLQPEINIITNHATGKHYVKYKSEYLGPYINKVDCDRAKDMLTIKLLVDCGRSPTDIKTSNSLVYPLESYYKISDHEAFERIRQWKLKDYIKKIQQDGPNFSKNNGQAPQVQQVKKEQVKEEQQQALPRAQAPTVPRSAPYSQNPSMATSTPGKSASAQGGRNDSKKKEFTPSVAARKTPISGPIYQRPRVKVEDLEEMEWASGTATARENAVPGLPPVLSPRISAPFLGVILDDEGYYAEVQLASTDLVPPPSPNSSEHTSSCYQSLGSAPETPEKNILVRSISCQTEEEASLAHDLLVLWKSRRDVAPRPESLNFPLAKLWEQTGLVEGAQACETHGELKACVDHLIESGKLGKLVLPGGRAVGDGDGGGAAGNWYWTKVTRAQERKRYVESPDVEIKEEEEEEELEEEVEVEVKEEEVEVKEEEGDEESGGEEQEEREGRKRQRGELVEESVARRRGQRPRQWFWTEEEIKVLERELKSALGKKWADAFSGGHGHSDTFEHISEVLKGLGFDRGVKAIADKISYLKAQRNKSSKTRRVHSQGGAGAPALAVTRRAALNAAPASAPAPAPRPAFEALERARARATAAAAKERRTTSPWSEEGINVLETELVNKLGEGWGGIIGKGREFKDLFQQIANMLRECGYDRSIGAISLKAVWLKDEREKEAKMSAAPKRKRDEQQQQQQQQVQGAATADDGVSSPTAAPAPAPIISPAATLTATPYGAGPLSTVVESVNDEMVRLLQQTPGLSEETVCKFMAKYGGSSDNRACHRDMLRRYATAPNLMRMYVEHALE